MAYLDHYSAWYPYTRSNRVFLGWDKTILTAIVCHTLNLINFILFIAGMDLSNCLSNTEGVSIAQPQTSLENRKKITTAKRYRGEMDNEISGRQWEDE